MFTNPVKKKLLEGRVSVGTWSVLASPLIGEFLAREGFDYVIVDLEHHPIGLEMAVHYFQAITAGGSVPIARLAYNDHVCIKRALDAGALGVIIPLIKSAAEALKAVEFTRFPPLGQRPYGGGRVGIYGVDYLKRANDEILVMLQIEHRQAVEDLDAILAVEGYDGCFIGPTDLAVSMGLRTPMEGGCAELEDLIADLAQRIRGAGKLLGTVSASAEAWRERVAQGFTFMPLCSDLSFMRQGLNAARRELEEAGLWQSG
ncbi:MAG: 2-dehydro-3-deoxyglucarate aldolase [Phycisphaerae bacterium]|nr:2-dehydro-3-deoxyglucarate aldolase [Phycisphaerae bacterium]